MYHLIIALFFHHSIANSYQQWTFYNNMLGQGNSTFLFCRYCDTLYSPFHIFASDTLLLLFLFLLLLFSLLFLPFPTLTPQHNLLIHLFLSFLPVSQMLSYHKQSTYDYFSLPADLRTTKHRYASSLN